ncbi:MAG TPA: DUF5668 domain-containing protein [Thermoanaerobaculia bacterium]|nr:DUF5668 domain-containing protein [Thermoanaerobaculia bacterium]
MDDQINQPQTPPAMRAVPVKLVAGLFFTVLGVLLTLDNLDLIDADRFLRFWPLVLLAIGAILIVQDSNRAAGWLLAVAGAILLVYETGWFQFSIFDLWPLLLIIAGAGIAAQALGLRPLFRSGESGGQNIWAVLSTRKVVEESHDYTGGHIFAFMGGCVLDLTAADIAQSPAVIDAVAIWGGITIRVPQGWQVSGEVVPVMGGIEIKSKGAPGGRRLIVRGLAFMGGMEIKTARTE